MPQTPSNPSTPQNPNNPQNPGTPNNPQNPGSPNNPQNPGTPNNPQNPGSPNNPQNPGGNPNNPQNPGSPNNPQNPGKPDNQAKYQGNAFAVPLGSQPKSLAEAKSISSNALGTISINGKILRLSNEDLGIDNQELLDGTESTYKGGKSYKRLLVSGRNYQYSKFGYINDGSDDYIFSQGELTTNVPSSGVVYYKGVAAVGRAANASGGVSAFTADFGQKTLTGNIVQDSGVEDFKTINIAAKINGNSFSSYPNAAVKTTGHFYGDNAAELGGIFQDSTQSISGSFGARRTDMAK
jgi:lipoprotein